MSQEQEAGVLELIPREPALNTLRNFQIYLQKKLCILCIIIFQGCSQFILERCKGFQDFFREIQLKSVARTPQKSLLIFFSNRGQNGPLPKLFSVPKMIFFFEESCPVFGSGFPTRLIITWKILKFCMNRHCDNPTSHSTYLIFQLSFRDLPTAQHACNFSCMFYEKRVTTDWEDRERQSWEPVLQKKQALRHNMKKVRSP